jgi:Zn-dependent protease with chaperone function
MRAVWVAYGLLLGITGILLYLSPQLALLVVAGYVMIAVLVWVQAAQYLSGAGEITPTQFSHLYPIVAELRQRFQLPRTRVFISQSPELNAFAFGYMEPYVIVLYSGLVDVLDLDEVKSVIGHEMGHIKLGHTRRAMLIGGAHINVSLPFPFNLLLQLRDYLFLWSVRCQELSADRVGTVASRRPSKMISSLVKLGVGGHNYQYVNVDDLCRQELEVHHGLWKVAGFLAQADVNHPFMLNRVEKVVEFVGGLEAGHDLRLSNPMAFGPPAVMTEWEAVVGQDRAVAQSANTATAAGQAGD